MSFRFRRTITIIPHFLHLNFGKKSHSWTVGNQVRYTHNPDTHKDTFGVSTPVPGLYYQHQENTKDMSENNSLGYKHTTPAEKLNVESSGQGRESFRDFIGYVQEFISGLITFLWSLTKLAILFGTLYIVIRIILLFFI